MPFHPHVSYLLRDGSIALLYHFGRDNRMQSVWFGLVHAHGVSEHLQNQWYPDGIDAEGYLMWDIVGCLIQQPTVSARDTPVGTGVSEETGEDP